MREIKFRAWDEEYREMVYIDDVFTGIDCGYHIESGKLVDDLPMMQYTGLKDKNGKEIYEGDIVKHIDAENLCQIIYEPCGFFALDKKDNMGYSLEMYDNEFIEVISNIYENPELLK